MTDMKHILTMQKGEVARVSVSWTKDGQPYDPPDVTFEYRINRGPVQTAEVTSGGTGVSVALVKASQSGFIHARFVADGPGLQDGAQEGVIQVEDSAFA